MDSKFFYKSSSLLFMMLAAHSTAQAAETQVTTETEKNDDIDQNASTTEQTQVYDVKQTIDASATPYNFETTENPVKDTAVSTEEPKAEAQSTEVQTEEPVTEEPVQDTTASSEEPKTEVQATEVQTEEPVTEAPAQDTTASSEEPKTEVQATEVQTEEPVTEAPAQDTTTVTEDPKTEVQATEVQTEVPTNEAPAQDTTASTEEPIEKTTSTTTQVNKTVPTETPINNTVTSEPVKAEEAQPVSAQSVTTTQSEKSTAPTQTLTAQTSSSLLTQKRAVTLQRTAPKTLTLSMSPTTQTRTLAASTSAINSFILSQNYTVPTYKQDFAPDLPKMPYRNGVAKPEGVVAHETANPTSTIYGEVAYMKRNWNNAFVHAFVDDNEIIETANTDYVAWGAGPAGNARFIHVELVRVYGKERFAKAINNYADYIATNLHYYDLPVDSAEYDGAGTLWSHKAVSNFLGGTDHADPYGWFQENGYTMDELAELVTLKYNQKVQALAGTTTPPVTVQPPVTQTPVVTTPSAPVVTAQSKMARIKTTTAPVYSTVTSTTATPAAEKANFTYYVNKKADYNGKSFYLISDETGVPRGWVESGQLTQATRSGEKAVTSKFKVNSLATGIYSIPWAMESQKYDNLASQINQAFNPTKKVTINSTDYYFGTINGFSGWMNSKHLTPVTSSLTNISTIKMYGKTLYNGSTVFKDITLTNSYKDNTPYRQLYITKKGTADGKTYYHVLNESSQAMGWINDHQIRQTSAQLVSTAKIPYKVNASTAKIFTMPSGGSVQQLIKDKNLKNQFFNVVKTEKIGGSLWMKGIISSNNTTGWIAADYLTKQSSVLEEMKRVSMMGKTSIKGSTVYMDNDLKTKRATKSYNMNYFVQIRAKQGDTIYYYAVDHLSKPIGWISDADIQEVSRRVISTSKKTYIVSNPVSYLYSIPAGTKPQRLQPLNNQVGNKFNVIRTERIGTDLWHKGLLDNGTSYGWIADRFLSRLSEVIVPASTSLETAISKQMALTYSSAPKVVYSDKYGNTLTRNATATEVRASIDPNLFKNDEVQKYQFLRLNSSQGIAASTLNTLLQNKGILANQGTAFAEASKLYNINEIYLISHALWETGNGTSQLSNGMGYNTSTGQATTYGTKYYNMYGTRAVDNNALNSGIQYAYQQGWNTPAKAIIGGAQYVAQNYFGNKQFTLYEMRWNPANPATHQYATDIKWASKNAMRIADFYRRIELTGLKYLIDQYK
ncbi:N-acetylmuramoyl-L-alanine amidase [Macrococcus brunensis]|uniref:N-acetylmuramoyl-L-alanine amidase n=1 Tax=Macrococcus brunensis TaxID=198483 RepID=UPI001EF099C3|nr:N-acetylmuramoyl-L-alanine amidase [Macrococcus brunensis]ULG74931.1 N-acetylmuramoyl-L-alanine amidase [Macrococcus brunensis]